MILVTHEVRDRRPALRQRGRPHRPFRQPRPGTARRSSAPGATPLVRLRVACLLQFDKTPGEGDAFAPGETRVGRQRFRGVRRVRRRPAQAGRDPTYRAPWGCAGSTAPRTCLSAVAPCTTLSPSVAAGSPHGPWPLSRQRFTRDTWHKTSPFSSPSSQPGNCLAATVSAPGRGVTP